MKLSEFIEHVKTASPDANIFMIDDEENVFHPEKVDISGDGLEIHIHVQPE